jgi:hypothetical protein
MSRAVKYGRAYERGGPEDTDADRRRADQRVAPSAPLEGMDAAAIQQGARTAGAGFIDVSGGTFPTRASCSLAGRPCGRSPTAAVPIPRSGRRPRCRG